MGMRLNEVSPRVSQARAMAGESRLSPAPRGVSRFLSVVAAPRGVFGRGSAPVGPRPIRNRMLRMIARGDFG